MKKAERLASKAGAGVEMTLPDSPR
jgi:hypothetical protein